MEVARNRPHGGKEAIQSKMSRGSSSTNVITQWLDRSAKLRVLQLTGDKIPLTSGNVLNKLIVFQLHDGYTAAPALSLALCFGSVTVYYSS